MPNFQRPVTPDITVNNWVSTPLWAKIDETPFSDSDFVQSENEPSNDIMEVTLETLTDPAVSTGHIVRYRLQKGESGGGQPGTLNVIVGLYQATTLIATATHSGISTGFAEFSFTLSGAEADAITDYDDLRIRFDADKSAGARTTWCELSFAEFETPSAAADHNQREFRIRITDPAINANGGGDWAQAINVDETLDLDTFFRIRFDIEETEGQADGGVTYKLQVSKEGGAYADVAVATSPTTTPLADTWPPVDQINSTDVAQVVASATFSNDAVTTDLLAAKAGFVSGAGMHDNLSPSVSLLANGHTELEWSLVIPRYYDARSANNATDTFDFRVVESDGTLFTGDTNSGYDEIPRITATLAVGHVGGTTIEQPGRILWVDANGSLYYSTEHTNNSTEVLLHKSSDGGDSWAEATVTGRPTQTDPEGLEGFVVDDDILHLVHRKGDDAIYYHEYNMSSAASNPDTWQTIDEQIDADAVGKIASSDDCSIVVRANGDKFAFYTGLVSSFGTIFMSVFEGVSWATRVEVDGEASVSFTAVSAILDADDNIQVYYFDFTNGIIFHRDIATGGITFSGRTSMATSVRQSANAYSANLMNVASYIDSGVDVEVLVYFKDGATTLSSTHVRDGTAQTEQSAFTDNSVGVSAGTSHQPQADLAVEGQKVHLLYSENATEDIFTTSDDDEAGWITDVEEQDAVTAHYINALVFIHSSGNGGDTVLGYVWDQGSSGDTPGFTRYDEIVLAAAPAGGPFPPGFRRRQLTTVRM